MAGKSKLLKKNKNKNFFQHGLNHSKDWRDWFGDKEKTNAINACKNKK